MVYLYRNAKFQAVAVWDVFSPGNAGDGVVFAVGGRKIALICESGKVYPGQAGEVDYAVGFLSSIQEKLLSGTALSGFCIEFCKGVHSRHGDNVKIFTVFFQVCEAWNARIQIKDLFPSYDISECLNLIDCLGAQIGKRIINGCLPPYIIGGGCSLVKLQPPFDFTLFSSASFYRTGWTIYCFFVDYTVWEQLVAINSASSGANCVLSSSGRKLLYSFERTISGLLIQQVAAGTGNSPPGNGLPSCGGF